MYPGAQPPTPDLTDLVSLIAVAVKYEAELILFHLRKRLVSPAFLKDSPFRVYAICIRFEFLEESQFASTAALSA